MYTCTCIRTRAYIDREDAVFLNDDDVSGERTGKPARTYACAHAARNETMSARAQLGQCACTGELESDGGFVGHKELSKHTLWFGCFALAVCTKTLVWGSVFFPSFTTHHAYAQDIGVYMCTCV